MEAIKERVPHSQQIVVTTNCLYRGYRVLGRDEQRSFSDTDGIRGDLALELVEKTLDSGARIVVCDGGSSSDFISLLRDFEDDGLTIVSSNILGRGPQRRTAFKVAVGLSGVRAIVYTQAEKAPLVKDLAKTSQPILEGSAEVVILGREPKLFERTYPEYMRDSELRVNTTYDWFMRRAGLMGEDESYDWFFGPFVFKNIPEISSLFLKEYWFKSPVYSRKGANPNPEMHSNGHYFPLIEAMFYKRGVTGIEIPFPYPPLQKANEESPESIDAFINRRELDAEAYRLEALHLLALLKGNPRSKLKEIIR